jgi:Methyltransferase FkbM domain
VNLTRLDDFIFSEPGWQTFKLVKIDAEGFDCSIIRGATNFLRDVHPVIHFEYNRENMHAIGEPGIDTLLLLSGLGYSHVTIQILGADSSVRLLFRSRISSKTCMIMQTVFTVEFRNTILPRFTRVTVI